jgi:hypothetical protein
MEFELADANVIAADGEEWTNKTPWRAFGKKRHAFGRTAARSEGQAASASEERALTVVRRVSSGCRRPPASSTTPEMPPHPIGVVWYKPDP